MGVSSIECGDFGIALRLLPFGLDARVLEALREVLLNGLDAPRIAPKQHHRWGEIAAFDGPGDGIIADIEQGLQVRCGHDAE
jgi:hypothetical protein